MIPLLIAALRASSTGWSIRFYALVRTDYTGINRLFALPIPILPFHNSDETLFSILHR